MPPVRNNEYPDDGTSAGGDDTYTYDDTTMTGESRYKKGLPILRKLFASCEDDALGSVHRAWAVTVLFMVVFFVVSIIEGEMLKMDMLPTPTLSSRAKSTSCVIFSPPVI